MWSRATRSWPRRPSTRTDTAARWSSCCSSLWYWEWLLRQSSFPGWKNKLSRSWRDSIRRFSFLVCKSYYFLSKCYNFSKASFPVTFSTCIKEDISTKYGKHKSRMQQVWLEQNFSNVSMIFKWFNTKLYSTRSFCFVFLSKWFHRYTKLNQTYSNSRLGIQTESKWSNGFTIGNLKKTKSSA